MSTKYTAGPWQFSSDGTWLGGGDSDEAATKAGFLEEIAKITIYNHHGRGASNAALIAAAPDAYELLSSMREWAEEEEQDLNSEDRPFAVKILAYLAKAEGKEP